jgi:O-antigen biosynthesis protein WbqP
MRKRLIDLIIIIFAVIVFSVPFIIVFAALKCFSPGPAIYWSRRRGMNGVFFMMPKFRTMRLDTPEVASDKLLNPEKYITRIGRLLRYTSLDELPQIFSVLKGDMSVVGPRPALYTQVELIEKRERLGINNLRPGITGWAQVNGRDELDLAEKIEFDYIYLQQQSTLFDLRIILATVFRVVQLKNIRH